MFNSQVLTVLNVLMDSFIMLIDVNKLVPYARPIINQQEIALHATVDGLYSMEVVSILMQQLLLSHSVLSLIQSKMSVLFVWIIIIWHQEHNVGQYQYLVELMIVSLENALAVLHLVLIFRMENAFSCLELCKDAQNIQALIV